MFSSRGIPLEQLRDLMFFERATETAHKNKFKDIKKFLETPTDQLSLVLQKEQQTKRFEIPTMDQHVALVVVHDKELGKKTVLREANQIANNSLYSINESVYIRGLKRALDDLVRLVNKK